MKANARFEPPEHSWSAEALPWYVNGTLAEGDRRRLRAHLESCEECRRDLELEERLARGVATAAAVDYAPKASLAKAMKRLDQPPPPWSLRRWRRARSSAPSAQRGPFSFVIAAQAAALVVLAVSLSWLAWNPEAPRDYYRQAGGSAPTLPHLQVIFDDKVGAADTLAILARVRGRVIAGPSAAGVFLIAIDAPGDAALNSATQTLQDDPGVRFVAVVQAPGRH